MDNEITLPHQSSIYQHPLTSGGLLSFSDIEDEEGEMDISVYDRLHDLNELTLEFCEEDLLEYFFREYYIEQNSFDVISEKIGVPKKTISNWFHRYFLWSPRDSNTEVTDKTKRRMSQSGLGNENGEKGYRTYRRQTAEKVQELLLERSPDWVDKAFPIVDFNGYRKPLNKGKLIFKYFGYPEVTDKTKRRMSQSGLGNENGEKGYRTYRRQTAEKVQELLLERSPDWVDKAFPIVDFNGYRKPLNKGKLIFKYFGYPEDFFESLVIKYREEGIGYRAISTIINVFLKHLVKMLDYKIIAPKISKQTVRNYDLRDKEKKK